MKIIDIVENAVPIGPDGFVAGEWTSLDPFNIPKSQMANRSRSQSIAVKIISYRADKYTVEDQNGFKFKATLADLSKPKAGYSKLHEGAVKRDYIDKLEDERLGTKRMVSTSTSTRSSQHDKQIAGLAKKANVDVAKVSQMWKSQCSKVSASHPNRWGIIYNNVKRELGV